METVVSIHYMFWLKAMKTRNVSGGVRDFNTSNVVVKEPAFLLEEAYWEFQYIRVTVKARPLQHVCPGCGVSIHHMF